MWESYFGGAEDDSAESVWETPGGEFQIVGTTLSFTTYVREQVYLLRADINGNCTDERAEGHYWYQHWGCGGDATSDGGLVVLGQFYYMGKLAPFLVRYDSAGDTLWLKEWGSNVADTYSYGRSVQETRDGGFVFAEATTLSRLP
jgi:hypothetical protein